MNSCKVDEFKFDELEIKEGWETKLIVPLFYGDMEFKDFITEWYHYEPDFTLGEPVTTLKYKYEYYQKVPTHLIFEPSVVLDSFPFLVQGNYALDSISLEFIVTNASPYPLNLELHFFNKANVSLMADPVNPEPFAAGKFTGTTFESTKTVKTVTFSPTQNEIFAYSNRVRFISWYDQNSYQRDTLLADYPIEVSILLHGVLKNKNEEQ